MEGPSHAWRGARASYRRGRAYDPGDPRAARVIDRIAAVVQRFYPDTRLHGPCPPSLLGQMPARRLYYALLARHAGLGVCGIARLVGLSHCAVTRALTPVLRSGTPEEAALLDRASTALGLAGRHDAALPIAHRKPSGRAVRPRPLYARSRSGTG